MKPTTLFGMRALVLLPLLVMTNAAAAVAQPAASQPTTPSNSDGRWTPYLGCWRLLAENVRSESGEVMTVCVRPSSSPSSAMAGVTLTTFADRKPVLEQTIVADGAGHPVSEPGCTGTQTSNWSRDGLRLFTRVEMACNDRPVQTISGLTLFAKGPTWLDIQARNTNGDQQVRVRRYARTFDRPEGVDALPESLTERAIADALTLSTQTLTREAVMEASAAVSSQAVEAAIVETGSRFTLNSRALRQLADAHVSPNVIDLMVAQSFPDHFRIEKPSADAFPTSTVLMGPMMGGYYGMYNPYAFYNYYYSPFAFPYYYITGGPPVVIGGGGGGSITVPGAPAERGLVVNGLGYTRVHTGAEPDGVAAQPSEHPAGSAARTVRGPAAGSGADASSGSAGSSASSGSSGSSSSGGVSSSGGYSNGDAAGSGRTAQPR